MEAAEPQDEVMVSPSQSQNEGGECITKGSVKVLSKSFVVAELPCR